MKTTILLLLLALAAPACRSVPPAAASAGSYTSDSVRQAQLERFRAGLPAVAELSGGMPSRDSLVRAFLHGVGAGDTLLLQRLALTRAEWGWLYYPSNPEARPPYDLDPATMWFTTSQQGARGYARALEHLRGKPLAYAGHRCEGSASRQGENTVYGPCLVAVVQAAGDTVQGRLFGLIIERHGMYKFVNYANKLD